MLFTFLLAARVEAVDVTLVPIDGAFAANSMNHVAFRQNALKTVGNQQFAAYYDDNGLVTVARRALGSTQWSIFNTAYTDNNSNLIDDHNVITFGVDGDGYMHLSWGMHNNNLRYIRSTAPVTGAAAIAFGSEIPMVNPAQEGLVTYPQFYDLPGGDLLFMYRTGGSGNGDQQVNRYNNTTNSWVPLHRPLFDGEVSGDGLSSKNMYANTLAFDSQGAMHLSWTLRDTPDFQTNQNLYYAKSTDNGATWRRTDGSLYTLPMSEGISEIAVAIPQQSSLINQTSMTTDANDLPVIASWWAPGAQQGNHTRQYMLSYFDGADWQTSQITNRPNESKQGGSTVRDLARPIVVVDDDNRVVVAMRYDQRGDVVTIAHSEDRQNWNFVDLTTEALGDWEPNYDAELWSREQKLHLLYQPVGLGQQNSTISVLEWDAGAYLDAFYAPKLSLRIDRTTGAATLLNTTGETISLDALTLTSATGQLDPAGWVGLTGQGVAGWIETGAGATQLSEQSESPLAIPTGASLSLGAVFAPDVAFGVDATANVAASYTPVGGDAVPLNIEYVGASANNLTLLVDPATGATRLVNTSSFPVAIEGYSIRSASGSLKPGSADWISLADAGIGSWQEANPKPTALNELIESGTQLIESGDAFDMGTPFNTGGAQDLTLNFLIAGDAVGTPGLVRYTSQTATLPGDFNADGVVDAADYSVWRDALGQFVDLPNDATPGLVSPSDYADWAANYGATLATALSAVPEPTAALTAAVVTAFAATLRRWS
jgi:hypothetical protein